jgi:hypothetical protein
MKLIGEPRRRSNLQILAFMVIKTVNAPLLKTFIKKPCTLTIKPAVTNLEMSLLTLIQETLNKKKPTYLACLLLHES